MQREKCTFIKEKSGDQYLNKMTKLPITNSGMTRNFVPWYFDLGKINYTKSPFKYLLQNVESKSNQAYRS